MDNEKLIKIIESCHFNFLIGSGASRAYLETLGNIEELLNNLDKDEKGNEQETWFKVLDTSIKYWYFDKCIRGNLKLINPDWTIDQKKQKEFLETYDNYSNLLQSINILLLKRKNKLLPRQVNIFTTNMDVFIDIILDTLGLEFNDGFSGKFQSTYNTSNYQKSFFKNSSQYSLSSELPLFNLFKLHGSLTWNKNEENIIKYDSTLTAAKTLDRLVFEDASLIPLVNESHFLKSYSELKEEAQNITLKDELYIQFKTEYDKLVMINPTKEKFENTTLRLEYYEQIRMFSNLLEKENSVLFVSGFSFADEHIRQITYRALNSNPTLLIIVFSFDENEKNKIEALFPNLKYRNLYTDFVGFNFKKVCNEIFKQLAITIDSTFGNDETKDETEVKENSDGESSK